MGERSFDPARLLSALHRAGVRFILIGGMAAILHGDAAVTLDLDITPARGRNNFRRLAAALRHLEARIRAAGVPEGLDFDCSAAFLEGLGPDAILNLTTRAGALDIVFAPSGTTGYDDLERDAAAVEIAEDITIPVASLADVLRSKSAADREKDRRAVPRLRNLLERISTPRRGHG